MKRLLVAIAAMAALLALVASVAFASDDHQAGPQPGSDHITFGNPRTPIHHVVEIFQENVSFDHYFGTYPQAANSDGQSFSALPHTPAIDGLLPATSSS